MLGLAHLLGLGVCNKGQATWHSIPYACKLPLNGRYPSSFASFLMEGPTPSIHWGLALCALCTMHPPLCPPPARAVSPRGFHGHNGWTDRPRVQVALGVDSDAVVGLIRERLAA